MDNRGFQLRLGLDIKDFKSSIDYSKKVALEAKKDYNALNRELKNSQQTFGTLSKQIDKANLALQEQEKVMFLAEKRVEELNRIEKENGRLSATQTKEKLKMKNAYNDAARQAQILSGDIQGLNKKFKDSYGDTAKVNKITKDLEKTYSALGAKASSAMKGIGSGITTLGEGITKVGGAATAFVSVPMAGVFAKATKNAIDYNDQMVKMEAVLTEGKEATAEQKKELRGLSDTVFNLSSRYGESTTELNNMASELIKSGKGAEETGILLETSLQGSMAAGENFEDVTNALTGAMMSFSLKTNNASDALKNSSHTMDVMTYVANETKSGITELGNGIAIAGTTLKNMGIDLDTTASAIGVLSQYNIEAEMSARGLSTGLSRVVQAAGDYADGGKMSAATQAMLDLGVNLDDVRKNGVNLPKILEDINKKTEGMADSTKANNIQLAFGKEHLKTWSSLIQTDAVDALNKYIAGCKDAEGSTSRMANEMAKSPEIAIRRIKNSLNNTLTLFGKGFFDSFGPSLTEWADKVQEIAKRYSELNEKQRSIITGIAGIGVIAPPTILIIGKITESVGGLFKALGNLGKMKLSTLGIIGGILAISNPIIDAIKNSNDLQKTLSDMWKTIQKEYEKSGLKKSLGELGDAFHDLFFAEDSKKGKGGSSKKTTDSFNDLVKTVMPLLKGMVDLLTSAVRLLDKIPTGTIQTVLTLYTVKKVLDILSGKILGVVSNVSKFKKEVIGLKATPTQVIKGLGNSFGDTGKLVVKTSEKVVGLGKKIKSLVTDKKQRSKILDSVSEQLREVEKGAKDTKEEYDNLFEEMYGVSGVFDPKGRKDNGKDKKNKKDKNDKNGKGPTGGISGMSSSMDELNRKTNDTQKRVENLFNTVNGKGNVKVNQGKSGLSVMSKDLDTIRDKVSKTSGSINTMYDTANGKGETGKGAKGGKKSKGLSGKLGGKVGKIASMIGNVAFFGDFIASLCGIDLSVGAVLGSLADLAGVFATFVVANPLVAGIVAGIGAVAGAFYWAYKHVDGFRDAVDKMAKKVSDKTKELAGNMKKWMGDIKGYYDDCRKAGDNWGIATLKTINKTLDDINSKVLHWILPDEWADKLMGKGGKNKKSVKSETERFGEMMAGKDGLVPNYMQKISDVISSNTSIPNATAKKTKEAYDPVKDGLEATGISAGSLVKTLGGDGSKYSGYKAKGLKYADGTKGGHPGGLAMVNDGYGPHYREAVTLPNGRTFIPEGKNLIMDLPAGTQVTDGRTTNKALKAGIFKYADGTSGQDGFWASVWGKIKGVGSNIKKVMEDLVGNVMDWVDKPKELVDKVIDKFVGKFSEHPKNISELLTKHGVNNAKPSIISIVTNLLSSMFGADGNGNGAHGDLGSNKWFQVDGNWVREWQYRLLEPIIKKYGFIVTDGGRRTWDNYDHSKGRAMDIALPGNPWNTYWKVAQQIATMPFVKYVNSNLKSTITGHWAPSNLEPSANHIHISFIKELLSKEELKPNKGVGGPGGSGVERWRPYVKRALAANGLPTSDAYVNAWLRQIRTESGGNEKAMGGDDGLSDGRAMGLLQVKPPTFNANYHPGYGNIWNGYDNMLAAMNYAKKRYGVRGMLSVIGHGHGYEYGGLITNHQIAELGEGGKPEMVIPLTNKTRSVQLINKARKLIGEKDIENDTSHLEAQNVELRNMNDKLSNMINLLSALLAKDSNTYLDGERVSNILAEPMSIATNRINRNNARLRGLV